MSRRTPRLIRDRNRHASRDGLGDELRLAETKQHDDVKELTAAELRKRITLPKLRFMGEKP